MKILYVATKYDYGRPERGYSFHHCNFYETLIKMNEGANEIVYFPREEVLKKIGRDGMNEKLLETVSKEKPELVFFVNGGWQIKRKVMKEITQKSGAVTFNWFNDDHWKFYNYSKYWAPFYHWVSTTDKEAIPKYYKIGCRNVILSQWACNHFLYKPLNLPKIYDVTFIGAAHGDRKKIVNKIKAAGINIKCWGNDWPGGRVSQDEMLKIWSQSKINLNFTKSSGVFWKELASIFVHRRYDQAIKLNNPKYWLDNIKTMWASLVKKQIKGRNFEIPGCKTFFLTEYVNHLEDYYEFEKEISCFKNIPKLIEKIKYYLAHDEEREAIAEAGYERTLRNHTWEKRFNEIFSIIGLTK